MHVIHWLLTGLLAGLFARVLTGARMSLGAELALGSIGGLTTGTLMRYIGITSPDSGGLIHSLIALVGAVGTIAAMHVVLRITNHAGRLVAATFKPFGPESNFAALGEHERRVLEKFIHGEVIARDATVEQQEHATLGQRAADRIAAFGGSWAFMGLFAAILFAWMRYNNEAAHPFDPYPFILLNLVLSCVAAAQAPIILMSQNRQAEKDRLHARLDYEVNLKAEVEILALHDKLDELRDHEWRKELLEMHRRQLAILERMVKATE